VDSRTEKIKELRRNAENDSPEYDYGYDAAIDAVLAILTAEPEPCEDARALAVKLWAMHRQAMESVPHGEFGPSKLDYQAAEALAITAQAAEIKAYASQVADKRSEELRAKLDRAMVALETAARESLSANGMRPEWWLSVLDLYQDRKALAATEPKP
jgi:hypothetical protein